MFFNMYYTMLFIALVLDSITHAYQVMEVLTHENMCLEDYLTTRFALHKHKTHSYKRLE